MSGLMMESTSGILLATLGTVTERNCVQELLEVVRGEGVGRLSFSILKLLTMCVVPVSNAGARCTVTFG